MTGAERFEKDFYLGTSECDVNGQWKLASLLEAVQNTANAHSASMGMWHSDLTEKNVSWVLFKTDIHMIRYPSLGETVKIKTFTKGVKSFFCPRYYLLFDESGAVIAQVGSLLMLMDRTTRKTVSPKDAGLCIPDAADLEPPFVISMRQKTVEGEAQVFERMPRYSEIDVNGHVNNARYADWLCDSLGVDRMKKSEVEYASIEYRREIVSNEKTEIRLTVNGNEFQCCGQNGEKHSFHIYGTLRERHVCQRVHS